MAKKKNNEVVLAIDEKLTKQIGDSIFYPNGDTGWFLQNNHFGKKMKDKDMIVFKKESRQICAVVKDNAARVIFDVEVAELLKFAANVKKRQAYFKKLEKGRKNKKMPFFMHFNPELSFFFRK